MRGYDYEGRPFPARDAAGWRYTLVPLYRLKPVRGGWEQDESPAYLVRLKTTGGRWAEREAKGRYRLSDRDPPITLTSDHPDAV